VTSLISREEITERISGEEITDLENGATEPTEKTENILALGKRLSGPPLAPGRQARLEGGRFDPGDHKRR